MKRLRCLLPVILLFSTGGAAAAPTDQAYAAVNKVVLTQHIEPRYAVLSAAFASFELTSRKFCSGTGNVTTVQKSFTKALNAWMNVEHIRFGPVQYLSRSDRIYFWPDRRGRRGKHMRAMMRQPEAAFSPDKFPTVSAAVQGLPVAERLLYDDMPRAGTKECVFLAAIGANVAEMGKGVIKDWPVFAKDALATDIYETPQDLTSEFLNSLRTELQVIENFKLARPLGEKTADARPRLLESWRSGLSKQNIETNMAALRDLYDTGLRPLVSAAAVRQEVDTAFDQVQSALASVRAPMSENLTDPAKRDGVEVLRQAAHRLREVVVTKLAPAVGLTLGFNALDGD